MTQIELAKKLDCSQQFLSLWKNGKCGLKPKTCERWSKILGISPERLFLAKTEERQRLLGLNR